MIFFTKVKTDLFGFEDSVIVWETNNFCKPLFILNKKHIKEINKLLEKGGLK